MFDAPRGLVLTSRQVLYEAWPTLNVSHDAHGPRWSFVNGWGDTDDAGNAIWVHPEHLIDLDASIVGLVDLHADWRAWPTTAEDPWTTRATARRRLT